MNKFEPGQIVKTDGIAEWQSTSALAEMFVLHCIGRHLAGGWGNIGAEDTATNEDALRRGERLFSQYDMPPETWHGVDDKLWIITERDRSITTVLLPSEY